MLLGGLGLVVALIGPWRSAVTGPVRAVRRAVVPEFNAVRPVSATAGSATAGHPAVAVIDGVANSYWAEGAPGNGEGQSVVIGFGAPVDLDKIIIRSGASEKPEDFVAQPRPKVLHFDLPGNSAKDIVLKDSDEPQSFNIKAGKVTTVTVTIQSVYGSVGGSNCSISEMEFFSKD